VSTTVAAAGTYPSTPNGFPAKLSEVYVSGSTTNKMYPDSQGVLTSSTEVGDNGWKDIGVDFAIKAETILTKENSDNYTNRSRGQRGRVEFRSWAGDIFNTRMISGTVYVGPNGYTFVPVEALPQ